MGIIYPVYTVYMKCPHCEGFAPRVCVYHDEARDVPNHPFYWHKMACPDCGHSWMLSDDDFGSWRNPMGGQ